MLFSMIYNGENSQIQPVSVMLYNLYCFICSVQRTGNLLQETGMERDTT